MGGLQRLLIVALIAQGPAWGDDSEPASKARPVDDGSGSILVANRSSHDIAVVDVASGRVVDRLGTGAGPHLLSNLGNGRVAATGYGEFPEPHDEPVDARPPFVSEPNSRLRVFDIPGRDLVLDTVLPECRRPHASWLVEDRVYVTCEDERRLAVVSLADGGIVDTVDTRQAGSHVLSFDPASRTLGVSNTGSGSVTLLGIDDGRVRVVPLRAGSEGALAVDGRIWVANGGDGSISVVDPVSARVTATIESVCGFPIAMDRDAAGRVWVACFASAELVGIGSESLAIEARIRLEANPLNVLIEPARPVAWVSLPRRNAIGEIHLESGELRRTIRVGIEPDGLRWSASAGSMAN